MKQTILRGLLLAAGLSATAATTAVTPAGIKCPPKGNSYTFLVDYSGSMMESPEQDELTQKEKQEKEKGNFWLTVASFIVNKRKAKRKNETDRHSQNPHQTTDWSAIGLFPAKRLVHRRTLYGNRAL